MLTVLLALVSEIPSTFNTASTPGVPVFTAVRSTEVAEASANVLDTLNCPAVPLVPLTSESLDPDESEITLAVTPAPAELIAAASVLRVLLVLSTVIVVLAPDPTANVSVPESVSLALAIGFR